MTHTGDALLDLVDVVVRYPGRDSSGPLTALPSTSLSLAAGAFTCVAGRSGSGKTTLLHVAAGLLVPSAGEVLWRGESVLGLREGERARRRLALFGFVFQAGGLIGSLTAAENVALPGAPTGRERRINRGARARDMLAEVGLLDRADHFPSQLSGGEQQRVGLARALFADPAALIVDEPTANLDRANADAIIDVMVELNRKGRGLLVASHDERLIGRAGRVLRLD
jgi:ABC-type lipoprotein export system ATPase subunit